MRQAGQIAGLIYQHLRLILQREDLVVDLFERARRRHQVLGMIARIINDAPKAPEKRLRRRGRKDRQAVGRT